MIVAQVALSLVLLSSGGLVVRSFERLLRADPGFKPRASSPSACGARPNSFRSRRPDRVPGPRRAALAAMPGVTGASATSSLPLTATASQMR